MEQRDQVTWQKRARRALAGGVSSQFRAADPVVFSHGKGSRIWDVDGNEYVDFTLSQGPLIHGHSHAEILDAVTESLGRGQIWNGLHTQEIELAEKLVEVIPCADCVRLGCTGGEAVQSAIRLARAFTQRPKVVKFEGHYHGWLDSVAASINPPLDAAGPEQSPHCVPWCDGMAPRAIDDIVVSPWNDLPTLAEILRANARQVAAVITEPCMCNSGCIEPAPGYLSGLRDLCDRFGAVLIFDEVITGFRLSLGGAQQHYDVTPDLAVFGKAVAGGFPLSVIAGRAEIMQLLADGRAIHAGTLNAHVASVAASLASLRLLEKDATTYPRLRQAGQWLSRRLEESAAAAGFTAMTTGPGAVFHLGFLRATGRPACSGVATRNYRDVVRNYDMETYADFVRGMARHGVRLIGRGIWYLSTAHTERDVEQTIAAAQKTLSQMAESQKGTANP
jgi:glutamate-1-semialdehyde 2,1-aminomutase